MISDEFFPLLGIDDIYVARSGKLNCTAFRLRNGSLCLYSPVAGLEISGRVSLTKLGGVSAILAPNHYHNKGLKGHADVYPNASLVCSKNAKTRLHKITGLAFDSLAPLKSLLGQNQKILEPRGLKTGEVWVQVKTRSGLIWIVTDAFSAKLHPPGVYTDAPAMLGTFPRYGVEDVSVFRDWVNEQFSVSRPDVLLSCHGSPVKSPNLSVRLGNLMNNTL